MTYTLQVLQFTGEHGSKTLREDQFTSKAKARAAFLREVPHHIGDPDRVVTLLRDPPPATPGETWRSGGAVLACKYRRETVAKLEAGFF